MKKKKIQEVLVTKDSKIKKVLILVAVVAGIKLAWKGIARITSKKKQVKEDELVFRLRMTGKKECPTKEKAIRCITIDSCMSGMDLDLQEVDLSKGLKIQINAVMSGVCIRVPENIQVTSDLKLHLSEYSNTIPEYLDESLPRILITGKAFMSGIAIKFID